MTDYVIKQSKLLFHFLEQHHAELKRALLLLIILFLMLLPGTLGNTLRESMVDAYIAVSVFVALTLWLIFTFEKLFSFDIGDFNATHPRLQVAVSGFLGALPGCGGAIMVLTQFTGGKVSFGAVIAALTATMGDAAFLLIAKEPKTALAIFVVSLIAGIITGMIVDKVHGRDFLAVKRKIKTPKPLKHHMNTIYNAIASLWWLWLIPGTFFAITGAMQIGEEQLPTWVGQLHLTEIIGLGGIILTLLLWVCDPDAELGHDNCNAEKCPMQKQVEDDTSFVTVWVLAAFIGYEMIVYLFDIDLKSWFSTVAWAVPMIAIVVGFIPGCGPQIIVTTLYLNGVVPLSAQLGNALSNDGDALFPAIAVAPKAAIVATAYSAVPAFILGYGYYFLVE